MALINIQFAVESGTLVLTDRNDLGGISITSYEIGDPAAAPMLGNYAPILNTIWDKRQTRKKANVRELKETVLNLESTGTQISDAKLQRIKTILGEA